MLIFDGPAPVVSNPEVNHLQIVRLHRPPIRVLDGDLHAIATQVPDHDSNEVAEAFLLSFLQRDISRKQ